MSAEVILGDGSDVHEEMRLGSLLPLCRFHPLLLRQAVRQRLWNVDVVDGKKDVADATLPDVHCEGGLRSLS